MAKAKSRSSASGGGGRAGVKSGRAGRAAGRVGKGKLEVGNARRDSGGAPPVGGAAAARPARKSPLQLPGEKAVKPTDRTVPLGPKRKTAAEREPIPAAAVDRRRQIVGTDDAGRRPSAV